MMKALVLALALLAAPAAAETYIYSGSAVAHDNGVLGLGKWLAYGTGADLGDGSDESGVYYPFTANVYGGQVGGAFGVQPIDDGRIRGVITRVELHVRVRSDLPTGARIQAFVHRHENGWDNGVWGDLSWTSYPWAQWPPSPPFLCPLYCQTWRQDAWTDIVAVLPFDGVRDPWATDAIFANCYGIWVTVPPGGGMRLSEWELRVSASE